MTNTQSTLLISPDCRKNVSLAVLFGSNGNPDSVSTPSGIYIYTHNFSQYWTLAGQRNKQF